MIGVIYRRLHLKWMESIWSRLELITWGIAITLLIALQLLPSPVAYALAIAVPILYAFFLHMGFGSTFDAFCATIIGITGLGFCLLSVWHWWLGALDLALIYWIGKHLTEWLEALTNWLHEQRING